MSRGGGRTGARFPAVAPDLLGMVEAAYAVDAPAQVWTGGLLDAADRALGTGLGGFACAFQVNLDGTIAVSRDSAATAGQTPETMNAIFDGLTSAPPGWLSAFATNPSSAVCCVLTSEVDPRFTLAYRDRLARNGVHDGINIVCLDLNRRGLLISLGVGRDQALTPEVRQHLGRVATHVVAASRLRERIGAHQAATSAAAPFDPQKAAAVISREGKLLHAQGDAEVSGARRALQAAAVGIERARTSSRGDIDQALGLWKGLVSARWTLVDHFDAQGAKYILARENAPAAVALAKLTPTERCVVTYASRGFSTKEIAYTLGIAAATVRVLIMRAVRRCGARNRAGLLKVVQSGAPAPGPRR